MTGSQVVVVGLGELGSVFAQGLLRLGHTVVPVLRTTSREELAHAHPEPRLALITVAEADLDAALASLPDGWKSRAGLVQNELLPGLWRAHGITDPTVAIVWFEKKPGRLAHELMPTIVGGREAPLLAAALERVGLGARVAGSADELLRALVEKNVYILTTNIAGLEAAGTVSELWREHRSLVEAVAGDVIDLQQAQSGENLPRNALFAALERAIFADPAHASTGRSAPARLARALETADRHRLAVPTLRRIAGASYAARK